MVSPGRACTQPGLSLSDKRTRKPNSVLCGHSSRRRVAADAHQRPTRRFRPLLDTPSTKTCRWGPRWSSLSAPGRHRARALLLSSCFPPYLVLLRVGFTLPPSLLPERCALTAPFHPYRTGRPGNRPSGQLPVPKHEHPAVCFLWHWPSTGLDARVPDVIRHTALWSSDFPLPATPVRRGGQGFPAATARSSCQPPVYREMQIPSPSSACDQRGIRLV